MGWPTIDVMKTSTILDVVTLRGLRVGTLLLGGWVFLAAVSGVVAEGNTAPKDLSLFYQQNCARCHGADGSGRDAAGKRLHGDNFANPVWQQRTDDDAMAKVILKGKFFGLAMPSFRNSLSQEEALRMVKDILRKLPGARQPNG